MYEYVPRARISEELTHLRNLLRQIKPTNERERLASERREIVAKYIISNLRRTSEHPTLNTLREVADSFLLTTGAAHELFGYDPDSIREYDLRWNHGRTHIVESYVFERDRRIDLPLELAPEEAFRSDAFLSELVREWQDPMPISVLDSGDGARPRSFYVHVGTEDSHGSSLPPGSMALVEHVDDIQAAHPNPRQIYLLQFGNGYRCSRCVVTHGKLHLLSRARLYSRAREFDCPREVRIVGRIRMFAHALPQPEYELHESFKTGRHLADLMLPWEHATRDHLLMTKERRFQRTDADEVAIYQMLRDLLDIPLRGRTERRYRHPGLSQPHVSTLIQLTLLHFARYSDVFRGGGPPIQDQIRYSLATLLNTRKIEDVSAQHGEHSISIAHLASDNRAREFLDWSALLSFKFPELKLRSDSVVRLSKRCELEELEPGITGGSWMLLKPLTVSPDPEKDRARKGWSRPLYLLQRSFRIVTGYLERDSSGYALVWRAGNSLRNEVIAPSELPSLHRVTGVVVPI